MTAPVTPSETDGRVVVELESRGDGVPGAGGGGPVAGGVVRGRRAAAVRGGQRGPAGGELEKVTERLAADAPNLEKWPGADLIAFYLSPDRHPAGRAWSAKHADTQRRLCERFVLPVIADLPARTLRSPTCRRR